MISEAPPLIVRSSVEASSGALLGVAAAAAGEASRLKSGRAAVVCVEVPCGNVSGSKSELPLSLKKFSRILADAVRETHLSAPGVDARAAGK